MKKVLGLALIGALTFSCVQKKEKVATEETETAAKVVAKINGTKTIDITKSTINWEGGKKIGGSHSGTINLTEGSLTFNNGTPNVGSFTVDMTSINNTDLEGDDKASLEGHLKSDDFFGTESHPTSSLAIKSATASEVENVYNVTADLTIKGVSQEVTFPLSVTDHAATASFDFDRTKHDIKYGSGSFFDNLGDKVINDNIKLTVSLTY